MPAADLTCRFVGQRMANRPRSQFPAGWIGALSGLILASGQAAELIFEADDLAVAFVEIQTTPAHVQISAKLAGANLGAWLSAGDVNGDDVDDLAIGTQADDPKHPGNGVVLLLSQGRQRRWRATMIPSPGGEVRFGSRAEIGPDFDQDGFRDLLVSSVWSPTNQGAGTVFVYRGGPRASWHTPDWRHDLNGRLSVQLGSVTATGDINGDGLPDLVIGNGAASDEMRNQGKVVAFYGRKQGLPTKPSWGLRGVGEGAHFGSAVCLADVNADGCDDLITGAPMSSREDNRRGHVQVFLGSTNGLATKPVWLQSGEDEFVWFGAGLANAGDQNDDGFDDVWIAAPGRAFRAARNHWWKGRVYLYAGGTNGLSEFPLAYAEGEHVTDWFGGLITSARDLDGDGRRELLVGARDFNVDQVAMGAVEVLSFVSHRLERRLRLVGTVAAGMFGAGHCADGDFDGDGQADLVVSSRAERRGEVTILLSGASGDTLQPILPVAIRRDILSASTLVKSPQVVQPASVRGGWVAVIVTAILGGGALVIVWRQQTLAAQSARKERERIAADLHDGVGARLAELAQLADRVSEKRATGVELEEQIQEISTVSRRTMDSLYEAVSELKAEAMTVDGLAEDIVAEAERQLRSADIAIRISWPANGRESVVEGAASRAVRLGAREALRNIVRHAQATEVKLRFEAEAHRLKIAISDNGRGFNPAVIAHSQGGLLHGQNRFLEVGADWHCETAPGRGTSVTMRVSLQK